MNALQSNKTKSWKQLISFLLIAFIFISPTNAGAFTQLTKVFSTVYNFFCSTYMLVICTVALIVIGIEIMTHRGEPFIQKKLIPWLVAVFIIGTASAIVKLFFTPSYDISDVTSSANVIDGLK